MKDELPANPTLDSFEQSPDGLTLRDWFAAHALAGFSRAREAEMFNENTIRWYARVAYDLADAMLDERSVGPRPRNQRGKRTNPEPEPVPIPAPEPEKKAAAVVWPSLNIQGH